MKQRNKSNTITVRYINVEPPSHPHSPLTERNLKPILLARSWIREAISEVFDESLFRHLLVIEDPGSGEFLRLILPLMPPSVCIANCNPGKSAAIVGYLLFYLIFQYGRTILQSEMPDRRLGFVFDDDGVREVFPHDSGTYHDGKPHFSARERRR